MSSKNSLVLARRVWPKTRSPTSSGVSLKMRRIGTGADDAQEAQHPWP